MLAMHGELSFLVLKKTGVEEMILSRQLLYNVVSKFTWQEM